MLNKDLKTPSNHSILVPVDFSKSSENALDYAIEMARLFDNEIILLYAISENIFSSLFSGSENKTLISEGVEKKMESYKNKITKEWPQARIRVVIDEGKPYKVIARLADSENCDSIIMGTNGANGIEMFIGSTTSRVMQVANIPVIAVKEKKDKPNFRTIVLPIDLTKSSKQKVAWAIKFASKYNSTVHIIMEAKKDKFLKNKVQNNLRQVEGIMKENGVNFISKLLDDKSYPDHIGKDTVKYAEEINADLIMIMTQQEKASVGEFFIGSYAQQVVNSSQKTPVMAIKPKPTTKFDGGEGFY